MKGAEFYYLEFESIFNRYDRNLALEFRNYSYTHTPNYVYLWLKEMQKQNEGKFPKEIDQLMKDFFWEIW